MILDPANDKEWTCTLRKHQILSNLLLIASLRFFKGIALNLVVCRQTNQLAELVLQPLWPEATA